MNRKWYKEMPNWKDRNEEEVRRKWFKIDQKNKSLVKEEELWKHFRMLWRKVQDAAMRKHHNLFREYAKSKRNAFIRGKCVILQKQIRITFFSTFLAT